MALREIPAGSVEIQTGLWAYWYTFTVSGTTYGRYKLYSAEGYCFYEVDNPENLDEDGNLLPPEERMYAQYAATACTTIEQVNAKYVSVPVEEGYEVVSVGENHETM